MIHKKGDKILSVYWFAILIIVAGGISAMVFVFYNSPYDVREIESQLLVQKVADCISQKGFFSEEVFSEGNLLLTENNFLDVCSLNFNVEETWSEDQFYVSVEIYNLLNLVDPSFSFEYGNDKLKVDCSLQEEKEFHNLAECYERRLYVLDSDSKQYLVKILSAVGKSEKNVK